MLVWVKGRVEQKRSLTFCVFGQIRSKCFSSSTFPKSQLRQSLSVYGTPFHAPSIASSCVLPHRNWTRAFRSWIQLMSHKYLSLLYDIPLKRKYLVCTLVQRLAHANTENLENASKRHPMEIQKSFMCEPWF